MTGTPALRQWAAEARLKLRGSIEVPFRVACLPLLAHDRFSATYRRSAQTGPSVPGNKGPPPVRGAVPEAASGGSLSRGSGVVGPLLVVAAPAGVELQPRAVAGAATHRVEAQPGLHAHDGAVGPELPLLVGA